MKLKTLLAIVFALIIIIFSIQNSEVIEVKFLFWKLTMSSVLIILGSFMIGLLVGILLFLKKSLFSKSD
jgi:uncharacterized integral membrane protein